MKLALVMNDIICNKIHPYFDEEKLKHWQNEPFLLSSPLDIGAFFELMIKTFLLDNFRGHGKTSRSMAKRDQPHDKGDLNLSKSVRKFRHIGRKI